MLMFVEFGSLELSLLFMLFVDLGSWSLFLDVAVRFKRRMDYGGLPTLYKCLGPLSPWYGIMKVEGFGLNSKLFCGL